MWLRTFFCGSGAHYRATAVRLRFRLGFMQSPATRVCRSCASVATHASLDDPDLQLEQHIECSAVPTSDAAEELGLNRALAPLPFRYREVVMLFYMEDKSCAQTAAALGLPIGTVKALLHRGRQHMIDLLSTEGEQ